MEMRVISLGSKKIDDGKTIMKEEGRGGSRKRGDGRRE